MNLIQKGLSRDRAILRGLEDYRALELPQIQLLHFNQGFKSADVAKRKAQDRTSVLYKEGRVKRWRGDGPYCYALDKKPGRAEHLVALNWVRIWLQKSMTKWEKLHCFDYEPDYGFMRPDAFCAIKNFVSGQFRLYFIELDRSPRNEFDKVALYNKLFKTEDYSDRWWVDVAPEEKFPPVMVVTVDRREQILKVIDRDNGEDIRFDVRLLGDIKKECLK